jgi:type IV pilus assembly protein PilC
MTTLQPSLPPSLTPLAGDDELPEPAPPVRGPRPSRRDERRTERAERVRKIDRARRATEEREHAEHLADDRQTATAAMAATMRRGRTRRASTRRVPSGVLMVFSRQLGSFLEAGISVIEALEVVGAETTSDTMRAVIADVRQTVLRGGSFSDAANEHPNVFPGWYRAMVRSAEFTGRLDVVLEQLAVYLDRDLTARRQVKSALTYPAFVLVVAIAGIVVMSIFVLPKFAAMYDKLDAELPLPTRILLGWTDFIAGNGPVLAVGAISIAVLVIAVFGGDEGGKRRRDRLARRTPVVGDLYHLICVERFCRVLAALTAAGVPLPDGIDMSARSTNDTIFQGHMVPVREAIVRGGGLSKPMTDSGMIPTAGLQMIRIGERTGGLAVQLGKSATFFEREVAFKMKRATDLFQPIVIVFVGCLVGFVAIAQVAAMYSVFGQVRP